MNSLALASLLLVSAHANSQTKPKPKPAPKPVVKVEVTVDAKSGETLAGERTFRVSVSLSDPNDTVNQVEFYVNNDLRDSDSSTPYEFRIDSLAEEEGQIRFRFKAFTAESRSGETTITMKVDNGLSLGAAHHIGKGNESLADGKFREAITSGRIALKLEPKSVDARLIMARANLGLNVLDSAQKFAEDALTENPKSTAASELLAAIQLRRAFNTVSRDNDRTRTLATIRNAFSQAVVARRKSLDLAVDDFGDVNDTNLIAYADAALRATRYSIAISRLDAAFKRDNARTDVANRLAYAYVRTGRFVDAIKTLETLKRYGKPNAYTFAVLAIAYDHSGTPKQAEDALKEAILANDADPGVRTAQAFLALKRNETNVLSTLARGLASDAGQRTESWYFVAAAFNRLRQFPEARRAFERAVIAEPANADAYIERGNESLAITQSSKLEKNEETYLYDTAKAYYETAAVARPESAEALSGLALVALFQNDIPRAIQFGEAAVKASPNSAVGHYTLAAAYAKEANIMSKRAGAAVSPEVSRYNELARVANATAARLDVRNLEGRTIPREADVWKYLSEGGRPVVIARP
jgi:tetratricopeptide (TPR) repeat protein